MYLILKTEALVLISFYRIGRHCLSPENVKCCVGELRQIWPLLTQAWRHSWI